MNHAPLRPLPKHKVAVLGLVSTKNSRLTIEREQAKLGRLVEVASIVWSA